LLNMSADIVRPFKNKLIVSALPIVYPASVARSLNSDIY
jgi:hypothetical protein